MTKKERKAYGKAYNLANKEKIRAQKQEYYAANREKLLAKRKTYVLANPEKVRLKLQEYRAKNREKIRTKQKACRLADLEKVRKYARDAYARNPEVSLLRNRARTTRTSNPSDETVAYAKILRNDPCSYCGAPTEHLDHIVPLSKGGDHDWTNLTAACASCNLSKGTDSLLHFMLRRCEP